MNFTPLPCHETLRPFIRNYWMLEAQCTAPGTQQIFSNGAASLHFYLTQDVTLDGGERRYRTALFNQNMQKVGVRTLEGPVHFFGAEFVPFCARVFFRHAMQTIYATPEELHDEGLVQLSRHIHTATTTDERVRLLDEFFLQRLADFPEGDVNLERLSDVFSDIVPTDGTTAHPPLSHEEFSPTDLASTACLSQKQFTRVFNKYVGMNPKAYLRLLRFHKALRMLRQTHGSPLSTTKTTATNLHPTLTDTAWQCGYYDLAHMTGDFRDICGYSPSELLETGTELTEAFGQQFSGLMKKKIKIENLE